MWDIHNDALGTELVEKGFISVGRNEIGDLAETGIDRRDAVDRESEGR